MSVQNVLSTRITISGTVTRARNKNRFSVRMLVSCALKMQKDFVSCNSCQISSELETDGRFPANSTCNITNQFVSPSYLEHNIMFHSVIKGYYLKIMSPHFCVNSNNCFPIISASHLNIFIFKPKLTST